MGNFKKYIFLSTKQVTLLSTNFTSGSYRENIVKACNWINNLMKFLNKSEIILLRDLCDSLVLMTKSVLSLRTNLELNRDNHLLLKSTYKCAKLFESCPKVHKVECKCTKVCKSMLNKYVCF